jgi:hypothetical protein
MAEKLNLQKWALAIGAGICAWILSFAALSGIVFLAVRWWFSHDLHALTALFLVTAGLLFPLVGLWILGLSLIVGIFCFCLVYGI